MTKLENLNEKYNKSVENIEKRLATIERQKSQLEKKLAKIAKVSWIDTDNLDKYKWDDESRQKYEAETGSQLYWDICDVESKEEEIKESYKKLEELKKISANWKEKLDKAEFDEDFWKREIPESLKSYRTYLVNEWDKWDKERRAMLKSEYKNLGYSEFIKKHKYAGYSFMSLTDEEIHKDNEIEATTLILDLYSRVFKYTGKITSWDYLTIHNGHINGWVKGENANARVESILAGGYNIQRLHVRTLVHEYKDVIPTATVNKEYKDMSIKELEDLADTLKVEYKKYDNQSIYRMRLIMALKKASN